MTVAKSVPSCGIASFIVVSGCKQLVRSFVGGQIMSIDSLARESPPRECSTKWNGTYSTGTIGCSTITHHYYSLGGESNSCSGRLVQTQTSTICFLRGVFFPQFEVVPPWSFGDSVYYFCLGRLLDKGRYGYSIFFSLKAEIYYILTESSSLVSDSVYSMQHATSVEEIFISTGNKTDVNGSSAFVEASNR